MELKLENKEESFREKFDRWRLNNFKKTAKKTKKKKWTETIVSIVLVVILIRTAVAEAFRIPSGSMEDTLLVGDFLLVNKFIYGTKTPDWIGIPMTQIGFSIPYFRLPKIRDPKQGDVLVFKYPKNTKINYIKRCIATEGQTVVIRNKRVFVDGKEMPLPKHAKLIGTFIQPEGMQNPYIVPAGAGNPDNYGPVKVPKGHLFVMGDNRDNSEDSRFWGFLPKELVVGKATIIYMSIDFNTPIYRFWEFIRWKRLLNLIQ
ncbi:MAG: signal peptidase I [bacterium]|nr:signal peptidase I [bacterium]